MTGQGERESQPTSQPAVITRRALPKNCYPPPVVPAYGSRLCVFVQKINKRTQNAKVKQKIQKMCSNEEVSMEFVYVNAVRGILAGSGILCYRYGKTTWYIRTMVTGEYMLAGLWKSLSRIIFDGFG